MASTASIVAGPRKSFASVAAMAPPGQAKQNITNSDDKGGKSRPSIYNPAARVAPGVGPNAIQLRSELPAALSRLELKDDAPNDGNHVLESNGMLQSSLVLDDAKINLSFSSNKAPSLDGKSVASGTTFAMDEKESLRPDDSASLKAVEEDDSNSGPASGAPSSRIGSEAGGKAFRDQFNEISERMGPAVQRLPQLSRRVLQGNMDAIPQGPLPTIPLANTAPAAMLRPEVGPANGSMPLFNYQGPDEKLLEALDSPKDRLFLLQLEQQVISFIRDSQEPVLDLPPCNSFCRLLAHRLGDYYALTHYVDNAVSAVRLYRTPYCRLPNALSTFSRQQVNPEGPSLTQPSMKIMRRAGLGTDSQNESGQNTSASSVNPSKAGSEDGDESRRVSGVASPTDSTIAKDKASMTREEREAKYKETRERIFGGAEETPNGEASQSIEPVAESSRTSSASGKKKSRRNKNHDDDFEARSSYNAYWPAVQYPSTPYNQQTNPTTYFNQYTQPQNCQIPQPSMTQPYNQLYAMGSPFQQYQIPMQQPAAPSVSGAYSPNYGFPQNSTPQPYASYAQTVPQQFYPPMSQPLQLVPQSPAMSSPALSNNGQLSRPQSQMSDQHWSQANFQNSPQFQMFNGQQMSYQPQGQPQVLSQQANSTPYPYGQLPYQAGSQSGRSQHPLPGSYNRQTFNPQSRAFVPSTPSFVTPQPSSSSYATRPADVPSFRPGGSFSTPNTLPTYIQQPMNNLHVTQIHQSGFTQLPKAPTYAQPQNSRKTSAQSTRSQSPGQSSLAKWGRPENLPPKPPPTEASIKTNSNFSHGQGMPKFQNGTYTKP